MKNLHFGLVLACLSVSALSAHADEVKNPLLGASSANSGQNVVDINGAAKNQAIIYDSMVSYLNEYRINKTKVAEQQKILSDMVSANGKLSLQLAQLKADLKKFKNDHSEISRQYRKEDDFSAAYKAKVSEQEDKINELQSKIDQASQDIAGQRLVIEEAQHDEISDRDFSKKIEGWKKDAIGIQKTRESNAKLENGKAVPMKPELAALVNQPTYQLRSTYAKAEVKVEERKPAAADNSLALEGCQLSFRSLSIQKTDYASRFDKATAAVDCSTVGKEIDESSKDFPKSCDTLKMGDLESFKSVVAGFDDATQKKYTSESKMSDVMGESIAQLKVMASAKCENVMKARQQEFKDKEKQSKDKCKNEALTALAKSAIANNPKILTNMFDVATLKMVLALKNSGKTVIEDMLKETLKTPVSDSARAEVKALYQTYGKKEDLAKVNYYNSKTRLRNDNASALMLSMSVTQPTAPTDITEEDAAAIWAVETIRASSDQDKFGIGKIEGNLQNFSSRVYAFMMFKPTPDYKDALTKSNKLIDDAIAQGFKDLDKDLKKCLTTCETATALNSNDIKSVRSVISGLGRSPASVGLKVDPSKTTIAEGDIQIFLQEK